MTVVVIGLVLVGLVLLAAFVGVLDRHRSRFARERAAFVADIAARVRTLRALVAARTGP